MRLTLAIACVLFSAAAASAIPEALSAADAENAGRVEFPRAGFAVTYPDGWRLETTGADGALMHLADHVWSGDFCRAFYAPAPHTSEETAQDTVAWVESNGFEMLARTDLSLPAGEAIRLEYDRVDFEVGDYYVDLDRGGVANLECYASTLPDDRWLSIAETVEAIPVEMSSTEDKPPVSRFEFVPRVELPASGFAMDFPAEWEVLGSSDSPFGVDEVRVVLEAWADGVSCRVLDSSALWGSSGDHTLESMHEPVVERFSSGPWRILDASYLELPSGRSGRVVYEDVDGPVVETHADYSLTDGQTWLTLQCSSAAPPDDNWLSLAETVEYLRADD